MKTSVKSRSKINAARRRGMKTGFVSGLTACTDFYVVRNHAGKIPGGGLWRDTRKIGRDLHAVISPSEKRTTR